MTTDGSDLVARALTVADVSDWRALLAEGCRLFPFAFLPSLAEAEAVPEDADRLALDAGHRYGVFRSNECAGIAAMRREMFERARHRASIGPFYVRPAFQGTGAADRLMEHLVSKAKVIGVWQLELSVTDTNARAIAFYERHGFERRGVEPNTVIGADGPESDLFYTRDLRG